MAFIIGHSQVKHLHEYIQDPRIVTLSYPGSRVDHLWSKLEDITPAFEAIALLTGANDLPYSDHKTILDHLHQLYEDIHDINPRAQILVCDIVPRTQSFFEDKQVEVSLLDDINTEASTVNHALHLVSEILPRVDNVQFPSVLQDSVIKRHFLSRDGLHLSFQATEYVADTITRSIQKHLNHQEKDISTEIFSSPDSKFSLNNSPDCDSRLNSFQDSDLSVYSSPDSDLSVNSYPDSNLNSSIDSDSSLNSSPDSVLSVNSYSDSNLNSSIDSDSSLNSSPDSVLSVNSYQDSNLNSSIDSDTSLSSSPDSDLSVSSYPDSDLNVNSYPDSNLNSSIYSDTSLNSSPDSDLNVNSSLDSDLCVNSFADSDSSLNTPK